jgi:hypothetical protein
LGERYPAITSIAQSPVDARRLYAGTQDGKIWTTADGGENWIDITEGTPGYYVTSIAPSTVDGQKVFATYSGYRDNDHTPYMYQSDDAGTTWTSLETDIPMTGVNSFMILPGWNDSVLFAATDGGVYVSENAGSNWKRVGSNFPYMPVYDLDYNPVENKIMAATFSRGIMTFPVEELDLFNAVKPEIENTQLDRIQVYPTLFNDRLYVDLHNYTNPSSLHFELINQEGHVVMHKEVHASSSKLQLDCNGIPAGIYFLIISDTKGVRRTISCVKGL